MADELPESLIELQREVNRARDAAAAAGYSPEAWRPWVEAAAVVQNAISEYAAATGADRFEMEQAVLKAAREGSRPA
ncbi:hypothetical protein ACF08N_14760 [Streptomyces sp. NPDC015127]|uniref:hypothetical protein n=1 Tax=Streptomyces sp. NPDC015127 TaxID=3364939 RepID=UPI0036F52322